MSIYVSTRLIQSIKHKNTTYFVTCPPHYNILKVADGRLSIASLIIKKGG
ncbi:MAG: hypothetical protein IIB95_03640 [Candidatus Marinimicrobia bacterium]|nr:hypothetical protein [Candidatus Neomarinimicrobiota bacterium]MCH7762816.1 hypothetical protein [Candidatus Neomarinimicrobiota bacterium]